MANKKATYQVETKVDTGKAAADAKRLAAIFRNELSKISVGTATKGSGGGNNNIVAQAKAAQAQQTANLKAETAARIAVARAEAQERIQSARAGVSQIAEAEKRTTAQFKAELAERTRAQRAAEKAAAGPARITSGGGSAGAILAGGAALVTVQAVRQAAQYALAIADARTQNLRAASSFQILAGSAKQADAQIRAIREASGGTIDKLTAMQIATQATALKLASTAEEMGQLTRAARQITLVSATIGDAQTALTELSLFAANAKSFARADQLGLDVGSLKDRMKELQAEDASLDDSQAKLAASIQLLEERYGKLLDTEAAQASGAEKLRIAYAELKAEIASGTVGDVINEGLTQLAGALNEARVAIGGSTDENAQQSALEQMMKNAKWQNETFALGGDIGNLKGFEEVAAILKQVNDTTSDGVIGIENYRTSVADTVTEIVKWRVITDEQMASLRQIGVAIGTAAENNMFVADSSITAEQAAQAQREAVEGLAEQYLEMGGEIAAFANGLVLSGANVKDFTERIAGMVDFFDKKSAVKEGALSGASSLVEQFGVEEANRILEQQIAQIELTFQKFQRMGIRSGPLLDLGIADLENQLSAQVDGILKEADRLKEVANLDGITSQLNQSLSNLNSGAFDGVEGIAAIREELLGMASDVMFAAGATDEQAARFAYLSAVAYAASDSTSAFGQTQAALGVEFLNTNDYVGALAGEMANLDGAYATGAISADYHRAALIQLVSAIYAAAQAAGAAAPQLASLLALKNALLASGPVNTPDAIRGTNAGRSIQQREAIKAGMERREQLRDQQEKAAKEAAKGFKSAAGSAAKDFNAAAKSTKQAFENAAKTLEGALRKVPGLFGASEVTQEQLDRAKAGGSVNMADDYLRRLRDEVKNGKDWADVSIEGAKEALERIGIVAGSSQEEILTQFEEAWTNSSLFADKANLALINQDAVRQQLQIQDKIKQGQQNILDLFGATVDGVMAGVKAGDATSIGLVANELEGSDDKAIQEMAKGLRDKNQAMIDKVLALAVADPIEAGGGGGGGGGALDIPETPIFDPAEFYDSAVAPFVDAGAQLSSPEFFAGFDAFGKKVNEWQASAGAAMPMSPGMFGPAALPPLAATGSTGAVAGPALTVDPASTTDYITKLSAAFNTPETAAHMLRLGSELGVVIASGLDDGDLKTQATGYATALDTALRNSEALAEALTAGKGIGAMVASGLSQANMNAQATAYNKVLATALNSGDAATFANLAGQSLGLVVATGLADANMTSQAAAYITALSGDFATEENSVSARGVGKTIGYRIASGMSEASMTSQATAYITALDLAFDVTDKAYVGTTIGGQIAAGMDDAVLNTPALNYITALDLAFDVTNKAYVGKTIGEQIGAGIPTADLTGPATDFIADLKAAFASDGVKSQLITLGGSLVSPIFQGFKNSVAFNPWLQTIVDEVVSQALDAQATATVDAQSATVVTGAGVQR